MFEDKKEFNLELDKSVDEVFDETTGDSFLALRRLRWNDRSDFKLDIRRWYIGKNGNEVAGKGVSFITEQGPTNLINALVKHGFGETESIVKTLKNRNDFIDSIAKNITQEEYKEIGRKIESGELNDNSEAFYYDPNDIFGELA